jgi:hypothetical protein
MGQTPEAKLGRQTSQETDKENSKFPKLRRLLGGCLGAIILSGGGVALAQENQQLDVQPQAPVVENDTLSAQPQQLTAQPEIPDNFDDQLELQQIPVQTQPQDSTQNYQQAAEVENGVEQEMQKLTANISKIQEALMSFSETEDGQKINELKTFFDTIQPIFYAISAVLGALATVGTLNKIKSDGSYSQTGELQEGTDGALWLLEATKQAVENPNITNIALLSREAIFTFSKTLNIAKLEALKGNGSKIEELKNLELVLATLKYLTSQIPKKVFETTGKKEIDTNQPNLIAGKLKEVGPLFKRLALENPQTIYTGLQSAAQVCIEYKGNWKAIKEELLKSDLAEFWKAFDETMFAVFLVTICVPVGSSVPFILGSLKEAVYTARLYSTPGEVPFSQMILDLFDNLANLTVPNVNYLINAISLLIASLGGAAMSRLLNRDDNQEVESSQGLSNRPADLNVSHAAPTIGF